MEEDMKIDEPMHEQDDDVIVIKKSWLVTALVALIAFALGGVGGYFVRVEFAGGSTVAGQQQPIQAAQPPQVQPTQVPQRIDGVSVDNDPVLGPEDAKVTIVEFSDFQCPYCQRFRQQTFDALVEQYSDDIRIVYRDFPLNSIHPDAQKAAEAGECAHEQGKFWEMHDAIFANAVISGLGVDALVGMAENIDGLDADELQECIESGKHADEVAADFQDGTRYGVTGTPTFFINGFRLVGAQPLAAFTAIIDQELGN